MKLTTKITVAAFIAAISIAAASAQAEEKPLNPLKARAEARLEKNSEIRNEKFEDLRNLKASTSGMIKDMRGEVKGDIKDMRGEFRDDRKEFGSTSMMMRKDLRASTSEMFKKFKDDRKEIMQKMRKDSFEIRKNALVEHLNFALENLGNIRDRINERINKLDAEGKDTSSAEAKLSIADTKIASAKISIDALAELDGDSVSATATSTAEVELSKPRQVGDAAIKAVKDARDALKEVIQEIVKLVGKGRTMNATTTASTTTTI